MEKREWKPDILVLGPSGNRAFYILGALHHLHKEGVLDRINGYSGSSTGAIICLLLNVGYIPAEIITFGADTAIFSYFFSAVLSERISENPDNKVLISNTMMKSQLRDAIIAKCGCIPTLKRLYEITEKELYFASTELASMDTLYISHKTHPDMSCITAALLSMNIPLLFYTISYMGNIYIDGGISDPMPIVPVDDANKNILVIYTIKDSSVSIKSEHTDNLTSNIRKILASSIYRLSELTVANSSSSCRFLRFCSDISSDSQSLDFMDKAHMVLEGIKGGSFFSSVTNTEEDSIHHGEDEENMTEKILRGKNFFFFFFFLSHL